MPEGHEEKVKQIKVEYQEKKRQRDEERRREVNRLVKENEAKKTATGKTKTFSA
jgi:hypothetical protein